MREVGDADVNSFNGPQLINFVSEVYQQEVRDSKFGLFVQGAWNRMYLGFTSATNSLGG